MEILVFFASIFVSSTCLINGASCNMSYLRQDFESGQGSLEAVEDHKKETKGSKMGNASSRERRKGGLPWEASDEVVLQLREFVFVRVIYRTFHGLLLHSSA